MPARMERMVEEVLMVEEGIWVSGGDSPFTLFPRGRWGVATFRSLGPKEV